MHFKRLKPVLLTALILGTATLVLVKVTSAADYTITCNAGGCTNSGTPVFQESNAAPGQSITKALTIKNDQTSDDCDAILTLKNNSASPSAYPKKLFTSIRSDGTDYFGSITPLGSADPARTLSDLMNAGTTLGNIPAKTSREYRWTLTFDPTAGNEYQLAAMRFDFDVSVTCGTAPIGGAPSGDGKSDGQSDGRSDGMSSPSLAGVLGANTPVFSELGEDVLGAQTQEEASGAPLVPTPTGESEVLGAGKNLFSGTWAWLILILLFVLLVLYKLLRRRRVQ